MQLSAQEEYGLRCLIQVARHVGPDPLTIPEIAASEGLSPEYAAKLMRALRQAELVASTRGAGGGYRLVRPAAQITAWEAVQALGGSIFPKEFCDSHPGRRHDCVHSTGCSIRGLWGAVEGAVRGVLEAVTLAELARSEAAHLITRIDTAPAESGASSPR
ncbi:MAG TPA: Rrf2 family transcriptional regulator [Myxococcota bacterium]|nr:Rrf2 family transcriptional regulator [Myxococcota bacterium]